MPAAEKTAMGRAMDTTKHQTWKWVGSLFMEPKTGSDGKVYQAASLTKVLTLFCFFLVFIYWWVRPDETPDMMVYTLWAMLGVKSVHTVSGAIRARGK